MTGMPFRTSQHGPTLKHTTAIHIQIIFVFGFFLFAHPGIAQAQLDNSSVIAQTTDSQHLTLRRTDLNILVSLGELDEVLAQSSVLATLSKGQRLSLHDDSLTASTQTTVLLQANSSRLVAAVLAGEVQARDETAEPGEAIVWPLNENEITVVVFDAKSLLAMEHLKLSPYTQARLKEIVQTQKWKKFWGLLEHTHIINAESTASTRHKYLGNPVVSELMRQYPEGEGLRQSVAETFIDALRTKDLQTIEWLISPLLFVDEPDQLHSSEWTLVRQDFAFLMILDHGETEFAEAQFESTADISSWIVTTLTSQYRLWLEPFDGMMFVAAFESITEESKE